MPTSGLTAEQLLERYMTDRAPSCAPGADDETRKRVAHQITPHIGAVAIERPRPIDVQQLQATLQAAGQSEGPIGRVHDIRRAVVSAVGDALGPYLRWLSDPEPLVYSVKEAAHVLSTATTTVRRLIEDGILPTVPHIGHRVVIPRWAVVRLVDAAAGDGSTPPLRVASDRERVRNAGRAASTALLRRLVPGGPQGGDHPERRKRHGRSR